MPDVRLSSGKEFAVTDGETLLDAALRADVALSYSCRTGRCGTCRARLRTGDTAALHDEVGLSEDEKRGGWILTCVRSAQSNVELHANELENVRLHPARTLPCRIQTLDRVSADVLKVSLRLPPKESFEFFPGQYVDVIGKQGLQRSYSIANAPRPGAPVELHVRHVSGGAMSRYWFDEAKANDLLRLRGPMGTFFLRDVVDVDVVFLATGTGIAPVKSMLEGLSQSRERAPRSLAVLWGGRVIEDLYWDPRETGTDPLFVPVLSRGGPLWQGGRGYVQQSLLALPRDWNNTVVYACGSDAMIHDARKQLIDAGLCESRFYSDAFVSSAPS